MDKAKALAILREYMREYGAELGIREIGLFGSMARGEATASSDVDVVVDVERVNFYDLARIQQDLEIRFGASVDLIRKRRDLNSLLLRCIEEDAVYA